MIDWLLRQSLLRKAAAVVVVVLVVITAIDSLTGDTTTTRAPSPTDTPLPSTSTPVPDPIETPYTLADLERLELVAGRMTMALEAVDREADACVANSLGGNPRANEVMAVFMVQRELYIILLKAQTETEGIIRVHEDVIQEAEATMAALRRVC